MRAPFPVVGPDWPSWPLLPRSWAIHEAAMSAAITYDHNNPATWSLLGASHYVVAICSANFCKRIPVFEAGMSFWLMIYFRPADHSWHPKIAWRGLEQGCWGP